MCFLIPNVLLGTPNVNQIQTPVRLVGYNIDGKSYWVTTGRFDISAEHHFIRDGLLRWPINWRCLETTCNEKAVFDASHDCITCGHSDEL